MTAFVTLAPRRTARGVVAAMRVNLLVAAQYRVNLFVWAVVNVLQAVVYLSVWSAVAEANGGATAGYTAAQFAGYFLVMMIVRELLIGLSLVGEFAGYVRRGTLSIHLMRPLHPFAYVLGGMLAFRVQFMVILPIIAAALFAAFDAELHLRGAAIVPFLALVPLVVATKTCCDMLVACTSLWLTTIHGIRGIYLLLILLLGGQFAPLALLPDTMQAIAKVLPFYWMLGFPTELLIGRAPIEQAWIAIAVLGAWSVALYIVLQPVWRAGTRAYEAVGT